MLTKEGIVLASPSFRLIRVNQLDLQLNLLTVQEHTKMLAMLKQLAAKAGAEVSHDSTLAVWDQATQPEEGVEQSERTIETAEQPLPPQP